MKLNKILKITFVYIALVSIFVVIYSHLDKKYSTIIFVSSLVGLSLLSLYLILKNKNDFEKNMIIAAGFGITVISWFVTGFINNENEQYRNKFTIDQSIIEKKRDLRLSYLLNSYYRLANMSNRLNGDTLNETETDAFIYQKYGESALGQVSLLADTSTIRIANDFIMANNTIRDFENILNALRNEIRTELNLSNIPQNSTYKISQYRQFYKKPSQYTLTPQQQFEFAIKLNEANIIK